MPRRRLLSRLLLPLCATLLPAALGLSGCVSESVDDARGSCVADRLEAQPRQRFLAGDTFHLPTVADRDECRSLAWTLTSAPAGNENAVVAGADGVARFTPQLPGSYAFQLGDGEATEAFTAVAAEEAPFHNLNYFAGQSIAQVGDEIWTANVFEPSLTRLDPTTLKTRGRVAVGAWPVAVAWAPGMSHALVAQRGSDTLGLVDVKRGAIEDAIWVGDEPSNVIVSADGTRAYVTLATEYAVAIVDLAKRAVIGRVPTGLDPRAMALTPDGATLYVASYRSGQPLRHPYGSDPVEEELDITVIDTAAASVKTHFLDVGGMIQGLLLSEDDQTLYVTTTRNDTTVPVNDVSKAVFAHMVLALDPATGEERAAADLTRQGGSGGHAVTLHGMALAGGSLWVVAESSDLLVELDPETLAERGRTAAKGRPRAIAAVDGALLVHGAQAMTVTRLGGDGAAPLEGSAGVDPRPAEVAEGQRYFTAEGADWGQNSACNSCHADGLSDTLVWKVGPGQFFEASRPQFWLEGTPALGWSGYVRSVRNFGFEGNETVGTPASDAIVGPMAAYLASLMPPPPANGKTLRDGRLSEAGQRGKELFEGKAGCSGCHAGPLTTSQQLLENGITEGLTDVPSLVGAYRHGVWMKQGEARTLRGAVDFVLEALGNTTVSPAEADDITRYLEELTARDFFVLASEPAPGTTLAHVDEPIRLTFSYPLWDDGANLAPIVLLDEGGKPVSVTRAVDGRHLTLTPDAPLDPGSRYTVVVPAGVASFWEQRIQSESRIEIETAPAKAVELEGEYLWTVYIPTFNPQTGQFDPTNTFASQVNLTAAPTASGAQITIRFKEDLSYPVLGVISGAELTTPPLPVAGGGRYSDSSGMTANLVDDDGDGIADRAAGTLVMSAPGVLIEGVTWELSRPAAPDECVEGASGAVEVALTLGGDGQPPEISWGPDAAIGFYVTSPAAQLPAGPGQTVTNGDAYWVLQAETFPTGFAGPVTYGVLPAGAVDGTEANGGPAGGAPLASGTCYKFSVITSSFKIGQYVIRWP